ncbi:hypothetical protein RCL_jg6558.t1 [Rhizophagus clarus]|uniref:Uncharacterized protein n=1 Tax=Rhizophagus clarus TaxID=94130 RepID=A0A8H3LGI6_9GLOM|nr:hypothetical protein RCL_jg6558.t1 [Rhizophagus clarus]
MKISDLPMNFSPIKPICYELSDGSFKTTSADLHNAYISIDAPFRIYNGGCGSRLFDAIFKIECSNVSSLIFYE